MKLVDVLDSKSCVGNHVPVRVRPSANKKTLNKECLFIYKNFHSNITIFILVYILLKNSLR